MSTLSPFDSAYFASLPPSLLAITQLTDEGSRLQAALALAAEGTPIDVAIIVWGWDPLKVMTLRQAYGFTWVPALGQPNVTSAPGTTPGFGQAPYNPADPPPGSIKVSTSPTDYPPYVAPAPPPPPAVLPAGAVLENGYIVNVGSPVSGNIFTVGAGDNAPLGFRTLDGKFQKNGTRGGFFAFSWYEAL